MFVENLRVWREERNINQANAKVFVANTIEELLEIYYDDKETIKFLQEEMMDKYFDKKIISENRLVDSINDIQVFSINECELMGYDNYLTMSETIREISSRLQDPSQKMEWQEKIPYGKWKKDLRQPKSTLYEANYADCKRN